MTTSADLITTSTPYGTVRKETFHKARKHSAWDIPQRKSRFIACPDCGQLVVNKQSLMRHRVDQHNFVPEFKCELCAVMLNDEVAIKIHIANHKKEKGFQCQMCEVKFTTYTSLVRHIRYKHTKERAFKCSFCDFAAVENDKLQIHLRTHTGETPYKCRVCGRGFRTKVSLTRHSATHSATRDYICTLCFLEFPISNGLRMHLRLVHGVDNEYLDGVKNTKLHGVPEELDRYFNQRPIKIDLEERKYKYYVIKDKYRIDLSKYFKNVSPLLLNPQTPNSFKVELTDAAPKLGPNSPRQQQLKMKQTQSYKQEYPKTMNQYEAQEAYSAQPLEETNAAVDTIVDNSDGSSILGVVTSVYDNMVGVGFDRQEAAVDQRPQSKGKRKKKQAKSPKKYKKTEAVDDKDSDNMICIQPLRMGTDEEIVLTVQTELAQSKRGNQPVTSKTMDGYATNDNQEAESTFTVVKCAKADYDVADELQEERVYEFVYKDNGTLIPVEQAGVSSCGSQDDTPVFSTGIDYENMDSLGERNTECDIRTQSYIPNHPNEDYFATLKLEEELNKTTDGSVKEGNIEAMNQTKDYLIDDVVTKDRQICNSTEGQVPKATNEVPDVIQVENNRQKETVTNDNKSACATDSLNNDRNEKAQNLQKNVNKICTRLTDAEQLQKLKDGFYGKRPQVIEVMEDGRILDITENYSDFLPII